MSDGVQGPPTPKIQQQEFNSKSKSNYKVPSYQTPSSSSTDPSINKDPSTAHPNSLKVNTDLPVSSPQELDQQRTPLSLVISSFDNVQTLPTPMAYTPPAIQPRSPIDSLHVAKRRDPNRARNLNVSPVSQQRYLSELFPLPDSSGQRITSLPTVSETATLDTSLEDSTAEKEKPLLDVGEDTLTGYLIDHYDEPLYWRKLEEIGTGNFSTVFRYESLDQSHAELRQVAVKRIKYPEELVRSKSDEDCSSKYKELLSRLESSLSRELSVLKSLNHPCVVKLFGINNPTFLQSGKPLRDLMSKNSGLPPCDMIMSYCAGGDLLSAAADCNGKIEMWLIQRIFAELTLAVRYLHESRVIHRDLKLENILLKYPLPVLIGMKNSPLFLKTNFIELADFGLCKRIEPDELCTARCGSEDYVSPEILMGVPYDGRLSDTWALGVILYGLLECRLPFDPPPNATARQRNRATAHRIARFDWKWYQWANTDTPAKEIVENTLTRKTNRWMVDNIYESQFVKEAVSQFAF
ncbi:hypothetical protein ZYGR_0AV01120 [Zygosaccharomyces rouxii]|uniref:Protein kinase domain-containing protein n=1 Tax=Zygosaccharomyces rouxii TaxID=4956 RepID=A0A1Q3AID7_ZYGRO|nr:hypothetical protein ZYGR_0AV01120 [Zygosaccharomyces rouxii]